MPRDDQAPDKRERLVQSLPVHTDLEPPKDGKTSRESNEPHSTSDGGQGPYQKAKDWGFQAKDWVFENPGQAACYTVGAASLAVVASPALVSTPMLSAMGFGAKGVIANSAAAAAQAGIGNVVAPSLFSTLTSAGMSGYGVAIVNGAVQAGAGATATGAYIAKRWFGGKEKTTESDAHDFDHESEAEEDSAKDLE
ncbi:hypothetical protein CSUB01_11846 [Colletotrichum sublineola]|uniref:Interferon-induced 6-16 n=1 Tax=Colletotrichum sublineola TaxID=1173701 RepID=A0A066XQT7_COLSU|nr:hypothetical protein CSUB01_11846 [Colletotrichum sublineola]